MTKPVALYGKMLAFSRLKISCQNLDELTVALKSAIEKTERVVPVVLDYDSETPLSLAVLIDALWEHKVAVIGVIDGVLSEEAIARKLAIFPADGKRIDRLKAQDDNQADITNKKPAQADTADTPTVQTVAGKTDASVALTTPSSDDKQHKIHRQMVRSGQSIHHIGGDLIITGTVNHGAEVATDYNLHIYGKGQGRLVAGATGDETAHIFCQKFDPSLVSVAGTYCLKDDIPKEMIGKAVQVSFSKDIGLVFTLIG